MWKSPSPEKDVHFCPGPTGGAEWNGPAYDPVNNLIFTGDIDWCTTVRLQTRDEVVASPAGQPWTGEKSLNPFNIFGKFTRADGVWAGWLHAVDAEFGGVEVEAEVELPDPGRCDADRRRPRVFWRRERQFLCA